MSAESFDPPGSAYDAYRRAVITRHITCAGRYMSEVWLREVDAGDPTGFIEAHKRILKTPLVFEPLSAWTEFDGSPFEARTLGGACLTVAFGCLYMAWCGAGDLQRLQLAKSANGTDWQPKRMLDASSMVRPALAHYKGYLYLAWTGSGENHYLHVARSSDGETWIDRHDFNCEPCVASSTAGPCLAVAEDRLYLSWSGAGSQDRVQLTWTSDGTSWQPKRILNFISDASPAMAYFNGRLYLAWAGRGDEHFLHVANSTDGEVWGSPRDFRWDPCLARTDGGPQLLATDDRLLMCWAGRGTGQHAQWMWTDDGQLWYPKYIHINTACNGSPATALFAGRQYLAWQPRSDFHHFLKLASSSTAQIPSTRTYVPWLTQEKAVFGGGENPLLRGGLAMAALAVEYLVLRRRSSLQHARRLLKYIERCEARDTSGQRLGFFLRCHNLVQPQQIEMHASFDEVTGLVLGLYYLYLAAQLHQPHLASRIRALIARLGTRLKSDGYFIVRPSNVDLSSRNCSFQKGASGIYLSQWAFQQAFEFITGDRFEPTEDDYRHAAARLWFIYLTEQAHIADDQRRELIAMLALLAMQDRLPGQGTDDAILHELNNVLGDAPDSWWKKVLYSLFVEGIKSNFIVDFVLKKTADRLADETKSPLRAYLLSVDLIERSVYFNQVENAFNRPLFLHSVQFAIGHMPVPAELSIADVIASSGLIPANLLVADRFGRLAHAMLGDRLVNHPDDDFYAAVVTQGLLAKHTEIEFMDTTRKALDARIRMRPDLPAGEPGRVRDGAIPARVRWHNSSQLEESTAYIGADFCWESAEGDRVHGLKPGTHTGATGMDEDTLKLWLASDGDALLEAGGLDFLLPRALMSYWLGEPLDFFDVPLRPLPTCTCLPFSNAQGGLKAICCRVDVDGLLLTSM